MPLLAELVAFYRTITIKIWLRLSLPWHRLNQTQSRITFSILRGRDYALLTAPSRLKSLLFPPSHFPIVIRQSFIEGKREPIDATRRIISMTVNSATVSARTGSTVTYWIVTILLATECIVGGIMGSLRMEPFIGVATNAIRFSRGRGRRWIPSVPVPRDLI
jgi:hypothetical protein